MLTFHRRSSSVVSDQSMVLAISIEPLYEYVTRPNRIVLMPTVLSRGRRPVLQGTNGRIGYFEDFWLWRTEASTT